MTNLTTWTNFKLGTGAANTAWFYDSKRGWLNSNVIQVSVLTFDTNTTQV